MADAGTVVRDAALDVIVETEAAAAEDGAGVETVVGIGVMLEDMMKAWWRL
jgi:hypothetical protein